MCCRISTSGNFRSTIRWRCLGHVCTQVQVSYLSPFKSNEFHASVKVNKRYARLLTGLGLTLQLGIPLAPECICSNNALALFAIDGKSIISIYNVRYGFPKIKTCAIEMFPTQILLHLRPWGIIGNTFKHVLDTIHMLTNLPISWNHVHYTLHCYTVQFHLSKAIAP